MGRKQCTICWHIDDVKISHVDHWMVAGIMGKIEDEFDKTTVTRGNIKKLVVMDIEFKDRKIVQKTMIGFLPKYFDAFGGPTDKG